MIKPGDKFTNPNLPFVVMVARKDTCKAVVHIRGSRWGYYYQQYCKKFKPPSGSTKWRLVLPGKTIKITGPGTANAARAILDAYGVTYTLTKATPSYFHAKCGQLHVTGLNLTRRSNGVVCKEQERRIRSLKARGDSQADKKKRDKKPARVVKGSRR